MRNYRLHPVKYVNVNAGLKSVRGRSSIPRFAVGASTVPINVHIEVITM